MKVNVLLCFLLIAFTGCGKEDNTDRLELSTDKVFNLGSGDHTLRIGIESDSEWSISGDQPWCATLKKSGPEGDSLVISVEANISTDKRGVSLKISNLEQSTEISINQNGATGEYHFRLPVVFHVIYNNASDEKQYIKPVRLRDVLEKTNDYYRDANGKGVNMLVEFIAATHDPKGNPLAEAGINRVRRSIPTIDPKGFLENNFDDADWLWDQNKYINVVIFTFTSPQTIGITWLPFTPQNHPLEGLGSNDKYYTEFPTTHAHCIVLNNYYTYAGLPAPTEMQDVWAITLTHELGHYIGLRHAFSEGEKVETDYCDDTPDYNIAAYNEWLANLVNEEPWDVLTRREGRDGNFFTSTNLMDYDYGEMDRFTPDQWARVRHVLKYSPLIPGPKIPVTRSRAGEPQRADPPVMIR